MSRRSSAILWKKRRKVRVGSYTKGNSNKILISSPNTTKFKDLAWRGNCRTFLFVQRDPMETHSNEGSTVSWLMSWRSEKKRKECQIIFFPPWWCIIEYWVWCLRLEYELWNCEKELRYGHAWYMSDGILSVISCVFPSRLTAWCGIAPCTVMYLSHLFCVVCVSDPSFILPHCYVTSYEYVLI